jgi:hypothetical protein
MCPACIASTAMMVAGAGSTGGILAVCIGKFRKLFRATGLGRFRERTGEMNMATSKERDKGTRKRAPDNGTFKTDAGPVCQ